MANRRVLSRGRAVVVTAVAVGLVGTLAVAVGGRGPSRVRLAAEGGEVTTTETPSTTAVETTTTTEPPTTEPPTTAADPQRARVLALWPRIREGVLRFTATGGPRWVDGPYLTGFWWTTVGDYQRRVDPTSSRAGTPTPRRSW